jgi:DNA-binding Lrp family transcriptional regulator
MSVCPSLANSSKRTEAGPGPSRYDAPTCSEEGRMAVSAYILIQTEVGKASNVVEEIRKLGGIVEADDVTGPYDVIVKAEADTMDELGKMVVSQVQLVEGITRTLTCPVVNL